MNKKGISPLIATVLIIGFTVALTSTVMIWGKNFISDKTETEGALAEARLRCVSMEFTADKSCKNVATGNIDLILRNIKSETIDGFTFRSVDMPDTIRDTETLGTAAAKEYNLPITETLTTLDIVPLVKSRSEYLPCSTSIKTVRITDC